MMRLTDDPRQLQWALPESLEIPPDELKLRLDFFGDAIVMHLVDGGVVTTRLVSAEDIARALARDVTFSSGMLPKDALWWSSDSEGPLVAIWRKPQVWRVALQEAPLEPPRRFNLPMPGLVFLVAPGRAPAIFAAARRPLGMDEMLYQAPCFNVFWTGRVCPGTHTFTQDPQKVPEEFFASFFSPTGDHARRSLHHPNSLLALWEEIDGTKKYPLEDLVETGSINDFIANRNLRR